MKIRPVKAKIFHADTETDRQIDMMKLRVIVSFRNFASAPKSSFGIALQHAAFLYDIRVAL